MPEPEFPKDFLAFMQNAWNPLSFPFAAVTPTANTAEIEKRINELKAVETWLAFNTGAVQMTIKTLEMQKAALDSLRAAAERVAKPPPSRE